MKIIIVGCGKVGYTIAKHLSEEDNDIFMIDKSDESFDKVLESIDVMIVKGNALSAKTLHEVGVRNSDLVISVTNSDETNILSCLTAKKLGAKHVIARVRDPQYALELYNFKTDLGIDMIINPEQQAAMEISRLIRFPSADEIDTFVGGQVELVSLKLPDKSKLIGKNLITIFKKFKYPLLVAIIERENEIIIPDGETVFERGDLIRILGKPASITAFLSHIGIYKDKIKDVMIIGGGKIAHYLTKMLIKNKIKVTIVEINEEKCQNLSEAIPEALIINADGSDEEVLDSENINESGAVVSLTNKDEENLVIGLYAKRLGVPKTILKINRINLNLVKTLDLGSIVCPKNAMAYQIVRYVRGLKNSQSSSNIQTMYKLLDNDDDYIEALEFNVTGNSRCLNVPLKDLKIKKGILIGCIVRSGKVIIPSGEECIRHKDTIIIIIKNETLEEIDQMLLPDFNIFGGNANEL